MWCEGRTPAERVGGPKVMDEPGGREDSCESREFQFVSH